MTSLMQGWVFGTYDIDLLFDDRIKHQKAHRVAIGISSPSTDLLHISPRCPTELPGLVVQQSAHARRGLC